LAPLDYAYKTARHLAFISPYSKNYLGFAKVLFTIFYYFLKKNFIENIFKIQSKMAAHKDERWSNKNFYILLKVIMFQNINIHV